MKAHALTALVIAATLLAMLTAAHSHPKGAHHCHSEAIGCHD